MTPDDTIAYWDDPEHAASACDLLMRTYPDWIVVRDEDRMWRARHRTWPDHIRFGLPELGQLNELLKQLDVEVGQR